MVPQLSRKDGSALLYDSQNREKCYKFVFSKTYLEQCNQAALVKCLSKCPSFLR